MSVVGDTFAFMTLLPTPPPSSPFRGPLRWLEGVPDSSELATMFGLFFSGTILLFIAWGLFRSVLSAWWNGMGTINPWRLLGSTVSALLGSGLLWLLWQQLDHLAARMGVPVAMFLVLLLSEVQPKRRRRRN